MPNSLYPDQARRFDEPDLGPECLLRLSADDTDIKFYKRHIKTMRPRGRGFEPHRRHCVVVLEQDTFILA